MACDVYSNGANLTVEHTMGTLPVGFCPASWQEVFNQVALSIIGTLQGTFGAFTIGSSTPGSSDRDKLWFKLDANCVPLGWYIYYDGDWRRAIPHALLPGTIIDYYDANLAALDDAAVRTYIEALDDGDDGHGAFWYFCDGQNGTPDLRGRARIGPGDGLGAGSVALPTGITARYQGDNGGEESVYLSRNQMPADLFDYDIDVTGVVTKLTDTTGGNINIGSNTNQPYSNNTAPFSVLAGDAHNNLPPYRCVYPIMRSARMI